MTSNILNIDTSNHKLKCESIGQCLTVFRQCDSFHKLDITNSNFLGIDTIPTGYF